MELPLYELLIDEADESGVDFIALVDDPAIKKGWQAFQNFQDSYSDYPEAAKENSNASFFIIVFSYTYDFNLHAKLRKIYGIMKRHMTLFAPI